MSQVGQNFKIGKKCRNPRRKRKKWPFLAFKTAKLSRFSRYQLESLYTYSSRSVLSHIFISFKLKTFLGKYWRTKNSVYFFPISKFHQFKNSIWRCHSHVESTCFVGNQLVLSLKLYSWRWFSRALIFDRKRENMPSLWRHLRPTHQRHAKFL